MAKNKTIDEVLEEILSEFGKLPGFIGILGEIANRLTSTISPLVAAINGLRIVAPSGAAATSSTPQTLLTEATNRNVVATYRLQSTIEHLIASINKTALPVRPQGTPVAPTPAGAPAAEAAPSGLMQLAKVGAVVAASLAVLAVTVNLIEREFNKLAGLVKLFNPSVIVIFQQALDNLGATIGRAFVPVFQDATQVIRAWTQIVAGLVQTAAPLVKQFADIFSNVLVSVLGQLGNLFRSLIPAMRTLGEVFLFVTQLTVVLFSALAPLLRGFVLMTRLFYELTGLGTIVRILTKAMEAMNIVFQVLDEAMTIFETVLNTVIDTVIAFVSAFFPLQSIMDQLTRAVQSVIRNMYIFAIQLAKLAGLDAVVDALIASLEARATAKGDTAAQTPQIKSLEQLSKDLALAAATAGGAAGGGGVKNQQEFWAKVLEDAKLARANGTSVKEILTDIKNAILKFIPGAGAPAQPPGSPARHGVGGIGIMDIINPGLNLGLRLGRGG